MTVDIPANLMVDYDVLLERAPVHDEDALIKFVSGILPDEWCDRYRAMTKTEANILQFKDHGFEFLFDFVSELTAQGRVEADQTAEDRVVAVYGRSIGSSGKRDASRMRGFLGGPIIRKDDITSDKGHFIGHSLGGGLDVNLFPQRRDINRGWSKRGKVFRDMERYCAAQPGTFCFSRPLYSDPTWIPFAIEYGLLTREGKLWVEKFENI